MKPVRILYCHCAYARVVPDQVKNDVLQGLSQSGLPFDAVADLCEMSARHDPALQRFAGEETLKIAACYPRAVKWLFSAAHAPLRENGWEVLNMRVDSAESVVQSLLGKSASKEESETA